METKFVADADKVLARIEGWRKTWKHRKPCMDWERSERAEGVGFCKHYVEARHRKFKSQIIPLFQV
jgi:hypothetical protein